MNASAESEVLARHEKGRKVRFVKRAPGAKRVQLVGDFNGWDVAARRMRRLPRDGDMFVAVVELPRGRYEFKYLVDGEWQCCDEAARCMNVHGTENSVVIVE